MVFGYLKLHVFGQGRNLILDVRGEHGPQIHCRAYLERSEHKLFALIRQEDVVAFQKLLDTDAYDCPTV